MLNLWHVFNILLLVIILFLIIYILEEISIKYLGWFIPLLTSVLHTLVFTVLMCMRSIGLIDLSALNILSLNNWSLAVRFHSFTIIAIYIIIFIRIIKDNGKLKNGF